MQKTHVFFLMIFLLLIGFKLFAQEGSSPEDDPDEYPPESEWIDIISAPFSLGDKTIVITLGVTFPTFFSGIENNQHGLSLGGFGSLAYNYFITPKIFIGGELSGMFSGTRGGNMLYIIPFGARIGYQFWYQRFEFPVSLMFGGATQRYLGKSYFGPVLKPGASIFWRYSPEWSFGLNTVWWFIPQMPKNGDNVNGNFIELTLSARYHF